MNALMSATPKQTMSSREIAELTGKEHKNVLRVIRDLIGDQILAAQIEPLKYEYRGQWFDYYELNKRDSLVTVARLSPEFTAVVIDRWQELENQNQRPLTRLEIANMLVEAETRLIESQQQLAIAEPKAQAYDNMINVTGGLTFRTLAKDLNVSENVLRTFLKDRDWMQWIKNNMVTKHRAEQNGWAKTDSVLMTEYDDEGNVTREYMKVTTFFTAKGKAALELAIVHGDLQTKPAKKTKRGKTS